MEVDKTKIARQFIEAIPHAVALGMAFTDIGDGEAEMTMPYDPRFVGDPETGVIHGGAAVISHPSCPAGTATIDLRIDYMRPATPVQTLSTRAVCYRALARWLLSERQLMIRINPGLLRQPLAPLPSEDVFNDRHHHILSQSSLGTRSQATERRGFEGYDARGSLYSVSWGGV